MNIPTIRAYYRYRDGWDVDIPSLMIAMRQVDCMLCDLGSLVKNKIDNLSHGNYDLILVPAELKDAEQHVFTRSNRIMQIENI